MTIAMPAASLDDVLGWLQESWFTWGGGHQLAYGMTGAGKTTLLRHIMSRCCPADRVIVFDPKPADDPSWTGGEDPPRPITALPSAFGSCHDGGGPAGLWYRLTASHDPADTTRRFAAAMQIIRAEGHAVAVLDDAHELCAGLGLRKEIDQVLGLGRSAVIAAIVASGDPSYVPRGQFAHKWIGHLDGLAAGKAAAELLGQHGTGWADTLLATDGHEWVFAASRDSVCRLAVPAYPGL
jgi:hypothetical protein